MGIEIRYLDGTYLRDNPDWDRADSEWKAGLVASILETNHIEPSSLCDVGCGAGDLLAHLHTRLPKTQLTGWDISPQASSFWRSHTGVDFHLGDFHAQNRSIFDVVTLLDVIEHVRDPFSFLEKCRPFVRHIVVHFPLELSVSTVLRKTPLIQSRHKAGHLHFYNKDLALETLRDSGYEIVDWSYTGAALAPQLNRTIKTQIAAIPRRLAYSINRDLGVRLLGGDTLMVLARPK